MSTQKLEQPDLEQQDFDGNLTLQDRPAFRPDQTPGARSKHFGPIDQGIAKRTMGESLVRRFHTTNLIPHSSRTFPRPGNAYERTLQDRL